MCRSTGEQTTGDGGGETKTEDTSSSSVAATPANPQSVAESAFLTGDEYSTVVRNIMEMGYCREMVTKLRENRKKSVFR